MSRKIVKSVDYPQGTIISALKSINDLEQWKGWVSRYDDIAETLGVSQKQARLIGRHLVKEGLAYRSAAFAEDTGLLVGSGLVLTIAGRAKLKEAQA